jgi:hypothetical protein
MATKGVSDRGIYVLVKMKANTFSHG